MLNPQLTKKFFIRTPFVFCLIFLDKKHDHIISAALRDIQAYNSSFRNFNIFSLTFHFLTHKKHDLHCSHDIILQTKHTHTHLYLLAIYTKSLLTANTITTTSPRYQFINSKYTSPFFLNFT